MRCQKQYTWVMKIFFRTLSLCAFFSLVPLAAQTTAPALQIISTEYFDIIYPSASLETAALLVEYADGLADEVCLLLDTSIKKRIPVYINPAVQVLNAYFSPAPYNRIVLYDTLPLDGPLGGFRDTMLSVFHHELVHAVSLNIRTPFWQGVSAIFGDIVSVNSAVTMPMSFIEGVTVSFESIGGGGRLNDPLTTHVLMQDKLEGKFLGWKESAGARDTWPGPSLSYLYGGAFSAWLQSEWGMERYALLWKRGGGFNPFRSLLQGRFSQVYDEPLALAWDRFYESVKLPEPVLERETALKGAAPGIITAMTSGPDGIAWSDANARSVYFRSAAGTVRKLFDADSSLHRLSFSPDGRYLLTSQAQSIGSAVRQIVRCYDMLTLRFTGETIQGLRDAAFFGSSDRIVGIDIHEQHSHLVLLDRENPLERQLVYQAGPQQEHAVLYNPVFAGNSTIAVIAADGLERTLLFIDSETERRTALSSTIDLGTIRHLQSNYSGTEVNLTFIWNEAGSFYRPAVLNPGTGKLKLLRADYSGAFFHPVLLQSASGAESTLIYSAALSGRDVLTEYDNLNNFVEVSWGYQESSDVQFAVSAENSRMITGARLYNPLPWFLDGLFLPFPAQLPSRGGNTAYVPGFLFITGDPAERYTLTVQPAFTIDPFFMDYTVTAAIRYPMGTLLLSAEDHLFANRSKTGVYRESAGTAGYSIRIIPGVSWKILDLSLLSRISLYAPDAPDIESLYYAEPAAVGFAFRPEISWSAVSILRIPETFFFGVDRTGYAASGSLWYSLVRPDNTLLPLMQGSFSFWTPFVPLSVTASAAWSDRVLFSAQDVYVDSESYQTFRPGVPRFIPSLPEYKNSEFDTRYSRASVGGSAELTALTIQIQHGVPVVPLYLNRITALGGYRALLLALDSAEPLYLDSLYGRITLTGAAVIGALTDVSLSAIAEYAWAIQAYQGYFFFSFAYQIDL